jgi:hypothetical protein
MRLMKMKLTALVILSPIFLALSAVQAQTKSSASAKLTSGGIEQLTTRLPVFLK